MPSGPLLLQFSGIPGTGKSTITRLLARSLHNAAVIDKDDDVRALESAASPIPAAQLSAAAYQRTFRRAQEALDSGRSVIVDSPSYRQAVADTGSSLAQAAGVPYLMVELRCTDRSVLQGRLDGRPVRNYVANGDLEQPSAVPEGVEPLIVDTAAFSPAEAVQIIRTYLGPALVRNLPVIDTLAVASRTLFSPSFDEETPHLNQGCLGAVLDAQSARLRTVLITDSSQITATPPPRQIPFGRFDATEQFDDLHAVANIWKRQSTCFLSDRPPEVLAALRVGLQALPVTGSGKAAYGAVSRHADFAAVQQLGL